MLSYQDYISQNYVEIDGMPNCIKNTELGHKVKRCNISASINIDQSNEIVLFRISNNLYNSTYLINDLILNSNPENIKIVCKIKKKCKIYFLHKGNDIYKLPPELLVKYETNLYDFTICDQTYSHYTYQYYLHETNTPLEFTFMPNLICIFNFDDFEYINENDYITKNMIYQFKLLNTTIKTHDIIDKKKLEKLEQENAELKDRLKKIEEKLFMSIEHKYF